MPAICSSVACNLDPDILAGCYPLFEEERVEAIEWSFDALFRVKEIPPWFLDLIRFYGSAQRLIGHGVYFSLFSGRWSPEQERWLGQLRELSTAFPFDHVSEHFGFLTGRDFHSGAPLSIPYNATTLSIGRDRLARLQDACRCPVGLENLAFSWSAEEVKRHGAFLGELVEPVNGFIILDLHNLYCQSQNFSEDPRALLRLHPLHRVREIHISGGSWEQAAGHPAGRVRRDTHDEAVPAAVFELLRLAIPLCPELKYVVLEQLGIALKTESSRKQFYHDFLIMQQIVQEQDQTSATPAGNDFLPAASSPPGTIAEDEGLYSEQMLLSDILETAGDYEEVRRRLDASPLPSSGWNTDSWSPYMLETARKIARKWKSSE